MLRHHLRLLYRLETVVLLVAVALIVGFGLQLLPTTPSAGQTLTLSAKHVRPLIKRGYKRACSKSDAHHSFCKVEIALGSNSQPLTGSAALASGYGPLQFHTAYQLACTPGGVVSASCATPQTYGPQTIAIVDAGNFSSGVSGLDTSLADYASQFNIAPCSSTDGCLTVENQSGATSPLPADAGWSDEIALDVETAHQLCQTCKILLVEANDAYDSDLAAAENTAAAANPSAISNSWGNTVDDSSYDSAFNHPGIAITASTGDSGSVSNGAAWPADNPDVTAVAGTTLNLNTDNSWASETLWSNSGGGCSTYYSAPSWQTALSNWSTAGCGTYRSFGDVAADADPSSGAAINEDGTWYQFGGTSLASPIIASIYALNGGLPSGMTGSSVPYSDATSSNLHDIVSGSDCTSTNTTHCTAATGFDTPTGLGSPNGTSAFIAGPTTVSLSLTSSSSTQIALSWTAAKTINATISGYQVYRNGSLLTTTTATSYTDSTIAANISYQYDVVAIDSTNATSSPSNSIAVFNGSPEDINEDGHINLLDLSILASKYGQCGSAIVGRADINQDGCVNLLDLSLLASKYGSE